MSSFKTKHPDVRKINIEIFCLIFNAGMAAGIIKGGSGVPSKVDTIQLKTLFAADEHKVMVDWDSDADLRATWGEGNFDAYLGFVELGIAGRMKVVIQKT